MVRVLKTIAILLHDGFEQTEALATMDILHRSHAFDIILLSDMAGLEVKSSSGLIVKADKLLKDSSTDDFDIMVIPGGKAGVEGLYASEPAMSLIKKAIAEGKHVHAICAAPSILGRIGYLKGKKATCFPGFELGEADWQDESVVVDGLTVTGRSMGYSIEFAHAIVKLEAGEEADKRIYAGQLGLRAKE